MPSAFVVLACRKDFPLGPIRENQQHKAQHEEWLSFCKTQRVENSVVESQLRWDDGKQPRVDILSGVHAFFGIRSVVKCSRVDINTQQAMVYGCL